jgi:dTDP-4-amino-4,6-dideoxygalactose transaminase
MSNQKFIGFNEMFLSGRETASISAAVGQGSISGDGIFTRECESFFQNRYGFSRALLTGSCTHALEMAALLLDVQQGDEVILPSFTYVSTANAFALRGASLRFADSRSDHPNVDANAIANLITSKTKAIVPVHYAGVACELEKICSIARDKNIRVVEDAAQCIESFYKGKPLGSWGDLAAFSFHETKNITSGTGGMLVLNDSELIERAEIVRNKGTNRNAFIRGEVDKYSWVGLGSAYAMNEMNAGFLSAQLGDIGSVQEKRLLLWKRYMDALDSLKESGFDLPCFLPGSTNNAHMFFIVCPSGKIRSEMIHFLADQGIQAVFHYQALHASPYFSSMHDGRKLPNSVRYSECLLRLPLHFNLTLEDVDRVCDAIQQFTKKL